MSRYLRYTLLTLLWVAVAAYIVFAASAVRRVRRTGTVGKLEIEVVDSSSQGHLVSAAMVRQWISHAGIKTLGTAVDAVDLTGIERLIARNGFVDKTVAYVSYGGTLHIEISQRKPLVRLLTDGMNAYVTADGYVFAAPRASSLYVPVVTGSYRPPFPASYVGSVREHIDLRLGEIDERIAELEREKYPLYRREMENDRNISALRRMRIKRQWWRLEGSREFDARVYALREKKAGLRRTYRYRAGVIREEIERILHLAFGLARGRRKKLTLVDKANVIATSRLWRQIGGELAPQYPDVELEYMFVDNAAMQIIQRPTHFDVIVTENLFGDILTDEASVISGSLGMLPSASVGAKVALFEPIHGSYPQAAGKNIANPMATILSAAMLLEHVGLQQEGKAVRDAVNQAIEAGVVTEDLAAAGAKACSTTEVGDFVAGHIA